MKQSITDYLIEQNKKEHINPLFGTVPSDDTKKLNEITLERLRKIVEEIEDESGKVK